MLTAYSNAIEYVYTDRELCSILLYISTLDASFLFDLIYHLSF